MPSQPTIKHLQEAVANDPSLQRALQDDPIKGLEQAATAAEKYAKESDPIIYRTVVYVLSAVLLITALSLAVTLFVPTAPSAPIELIVGLGSTALGGLAGLLAPSPVRSQS
jgi:hypothetical protein